MSGKAGRMLAGDAGGVAEAVRLLRGGGIVALPTETVYGLAARADDAAAVARVFAAKGRPAINPLIVHIDSLESARALAVFDDAAEALAAAHWPGPLTLVLPKREGAPLAAAVTAGLPTVALRVPAHPLFRAVLGQIGRPLAAPSANASGLLSPTTAAHVSASLGERIDAVLDGGPSAAGLESTIVAVREGGRCQLLREGPIVLEAERSTSGTIEAPGQMLRHYAPGKPLRLDATEAAEGEVLIGFGAVEGAPTLSATGDLAEAAARLYAVLHEAAAAPEPRIAVAPVPKEGVGRAINDRLRRAAR